MKVALFRSLPGTIATLGAFVATLCAFGSRAHAVTGAELIRNEAARYGKFEARIQFAAGDGVVSTFFLWKEGSEQQNVFWNELDIEKIGPDCTGYSSNAIYGNPESNHSELIDAASDLCTAYHTHTLEWTPTAIVWLLDGVEVRRLSGADLEAFETNALPGMQMRFNIWVGRPDFGGNFSPSILPVHQYINWVTYSEYAPGAGDDGSDFAQVWREDFDTPLSGEWSLANWPSPFSNSNHSPANVSIVDGKAVLSLTEDNVAPVVAPPPDAGDEAPPAGEGTGGMPGQVETPTAGNGSSGAPSEAGAAGAGAAGGATGQGGSNQGGSAEQGGAPPESGGGGQVAGPDIEPDSPSNQNAAGTGPMSPEPSPVVPSSANPTPASQAESPSGGAGANVPAIAGPDNPGTNGQPAATPTSELQSPTSLESSATNSDGGGCSVVARSPSRLAGAGLVLFGAAALGAIMRRRRPLEAKAQRKLAALAPLALLVLALLTLAAPAGAVASAELYTPKGYRYGKFEARINFPAGDGVVASFFLWKNRSEIDSVFWNELDFEKIGADCELQLNSIYGKPESGNESTAEGVIPCGVYHTYTFEWTPEYIAWLVDGVEVRRDTGADAQAYVDNAEEGLQFRFNIWPGTAAFGGNFSPDVLPVHEYISWVRYSEYTPGGVEGDFTPAWHESFDNGVPSNFYKGSWGSPLGQSTHSSKNVTAVSGIAVLSLTEDGAPAFAGTPPADDQPEPPGVAAPLPLASTAPVTPPTGTGGAATDTPDAPSKGGCSLGVSAPPANLLYPLIGLVWLVRRAARKRHASSSLISS